MCVCEHSPPLPPHQLCLSTSLSPRLGGWCWSRERREGRCYAVWTDVDCSPSLSRGLRNKWRSRRCRKHCEFLSGTCCYFYTVHLSTVSASEWRWGGEWVDRELITCLPALLWRQQTRSSCAGGKYVHPLLDTSVIAKYFRCCWWRVVLTPCVVITLCVCVCVLSIIVCEFNFLLLSSSHRVTSSSTPTHPDIPTDIPTVPHRYLLSSNRWP